MGAFSLDFIPQQFSTTLNGYQVAGSCDRINMPRIDFDTVSHRGGGMIGPREMRLGIKLIEWSVSFISFDPQILGLGAAKNAVFSASGYMDGDANATHTWSLQTIGSPKKFDPGRFEPGRKIELNLDITCVAALLKIDSSIVYDIDVLNGVFAFNGVDGYPAIKTALGLA